ncbi:hypothetical protein [Paenibacillus tengchongensis]|uniref:hypothetical protein n=1 Tax=Paenibacillus tengchongensis TaxID=2608684 RepID=UPI00124C582C|nr:hypothetical protein [Paenibacillus tengchongensis]
MQIRFSASYTEAEPEGERYTPIDSAGAYAHLQFELLTRSRMKMLKQLFAQKSTEAGLPLLGMNRLHQRELSMHPFILKLLAQLQQFQEPISGASPFLEVDTLKQAAGGTEREGIELYFLSRSAASGASGLFSCSPAEMAVQRMKAADSGIWRTLFGSGGPQETAQAAVFVTAPIQRLRARQGEQANRLTLLESGRLTEQLLQCAREMEWKCRPAAAVSGLAVRELLDMDEADAAVLSCLIFEEVN